MRCQYDCMRMTAGQVSRSSREAHDHGLDIFREFVVKSVHDFLRLAEGPKIRRVIFTHTDFRQLSNLLFGK